MESSDPEKAGKNRDVLILELTNACEYRHPDLPLEGAKRLEKLVTPRPNNRSPSTVEPFLRVLCVYLYNEVGSSIVAGVAGEDD